MTKSSERKNQRVSILQTRFNNHIYTYRATPCIGNLKFGEMEFGEMKRNMWNWSNFSFLACFRVARVCHRQLGFFVRRSDKRSAFKLQW